MNLKKFFWPTKEKMALTFLLFLLASVAHGIFYILSKGSYDYFSNIDWLFEIISFVISYILANAIVVLTKKDDK